MSRLNWFQRMRQREHLGGKKRDAMRIGLMSLQDELAKEVAGFGASLAKKAPHSELVTEGTDSRPMPQYQKPAEYSAMQDALVQELLEFGGRPK